MSAKAKSKSKKTSSGDNFFLLHGEKFLFIIVIALFAWMIKNGSGLDKFTLTPEAINRSSTSADENIKSSKVKPAEVDPSVVVYDYKSYAELIKSALKVNAYTTPIRWDQSLFPDRVKRPNIAPLVVENLKATSCVGAIQYVDKTPAGNAPAGGMGGDMGMSMGMGEVGGLSGNGVKVIGKQWVVVTGSIPVRKQLADYMAKFSNAQYTDNIRDQPKYILYELERGTTGDDGNINWEKIDLIRAIRRENNRWSGIGMEQVDLSYFAPHDPNYPPMAMSCPPMVNRTFGEEVANLPNIPVRSDELMDAVTTEMELRNKLMEKMNNIKMDDIYKRSPFEGMGTGGGGMGMESMGTPGMSMDSGPGMGGGMGGGMGAPGAAQQSWMINRNAMVTGNASEIAPVDYYLFRYFDFDVDPTETYYYRVKLLLANPNYNIDANFAEDPASITKTFITSEFSEPSNPVSLGRVSRIYAEQIEAASRPGEEPRALVDSIYFDKDTATESIVKNQRIVRGQVANFYRQTHKPIESNKPSTMGGMDAAMSPEGTQTRRKKKTPGSETKTVDHISDICVMDIFGGYKLPSGELRSPGKMIILEPSGLVQIRNVSEDERDVRRFEAGASKPQEGLGPMGNTGSMM